MVPLQSTLEWGLKPQSKVKTNINPWQSAGLNFRSLLLALCMNDPPEAIKSSNNKSYFVDNSKIYVSFSCIVATYVLKYYNSS